MGFSREELKEYWQKVIDIDKVTEFQKHHCSEDLKNFLEVEQSTSAVRTSLLAYFGADATFSVSTLLRIWLRKPNPKME